MPDLRKYFPAKTLQAEDICPDRLPRRVTIEAISFSEMKMNPQTKEVESVFLMKFVEFTKCVKLRGPLYTQIAEVLGSFDTDTYIGRQIGVYPKTINSYGKDMVVLAVSVGPIGLLPVAVQQLSSAFMPGATTQAPALPRVGTATFANDGKVCGAVFEARFEARCREMSVSRQDFGAWLASKNPTAHSVVAYADGTVRNANEWPAGMMALAKTFFDETHDRKQPAQIATGEVIDRVTGEVRNALPFSTPTAVEEDDIPF